MSPVWIWVCPPCELESRTCFHEDEAETLAGMHDALWHGGVITALTQPTYAP